MSSLEGLRRNRDLDMGNPEGKDKEGVFGHADKKDDYPSFDEHMNSLRDLMDELPVDEEVSRNDKVDLTLKQMDEIGKFGRAAREKEIADARAKVEESFRKDSDMSLSDISASF